jgi:hypothetical protein
MQKKCTSSPLTLGIGAGTQCNFSPPYFLPLVANAWIKAQNWNNAT